MTTVSTSINAANGNVVLSWSYPDDRGDPITRYTILILSSDGDFREDLANCDGASATIISARSCEIPMSSLTSTPFSLGFDALVQVKAYAINDYGNSTASNLNTGGARIRAKPNQMSAPYFASRTESSINVTFAAQSGTQSGNSDITSYTLYWDSGSTTTFTTLQDSTQTWFYKDGLAAKTDYKFYVTSTNIYGTSTPSTTSTIRTLAVPEQMTSPTVTQSGANIILTWDYPTDNLASV